MRLNKISMATITAVVMLLSATPTSTDAATRYPNCTALRRVYRHGVGRPGAVDRTSGVRVTNFKVSRTLYYANRHLDRDRDGIACEAR